ncbi:hypothetical protein BDR03DRAFT_1019377 [Suillus americanus]|nr:hypothetical protein BDR03DRAFT_1019377 [Suillus americanus]
MQHQAEVLVHPHRVPNICLGIMGVRTKVRLFFPALYDENDTKASVELTLEQKTAIYEDGLLPTLNKHNPETVTNWPTSYTSALNRARKQNNQYQHRTHPFPHMMIANLGYDLPRKLANKHAWARDMLFMVQVQGVKEANQHVPDDEDEAAGALLLMMNDLHPALRREPNCWIDVGLELSEPGFSYQWRTDSHSDIIEHFTCLSAAQAARYVDRPSRQYYRDVSAGLLHVSGFRGTFDLRDEDPVYIQIYTTDKALIQQLDRGRHGLTMSGKQVLDGCPPAYMQRLHDLYFDAKEHHNCAARIELRVRINQATTTLTSLPERLIASSILAFDRKDWWQWRLVRLQGFSRTLSLQNQTHGELRGGPDALALSAGLWWLTNGLHSRPDDGSAARDIMCTVLPLTQDYANDMLTIQPRRAMVEHGDSLPFCAFGAYFLRTIIWPPTADVPRMQRGGVMRNSTFKYVFRMDYEALQRKFRPPAYIPRAMVPRARVGTQKGFSKRHRLDDPAPAPLLADLDIDLGGGQHDAGEDLPWDERNDFPPELEEDPGVQLTKLWNQFCCDLLQKCGNLKNQPLAASHCRLTMEERLHVTEDVYKDMNLAMVFHRVQWKKVSGQEWKEAFDIFFPPPKAPLRIQPQNYPSMEYWVKWCSMKEQLPIATANTIRNRFWQMFKGLMWVPKPHKDRLWKYMVNQDFRTFPPTYKDQAPQVIVSPASQGARWEPERVPGGDVVGEEEEASEEDGDEPEVDRREWVNGIAPIPDRILLREEEEESGSEIDV